MCQAVDYDMLGACKDQQIPAQQTIVFIFIESENKRLMKQKDIQIPEIGRGKWEKDNLGRKYRLWTFANFIDSFYLLHLHLSLLLHLSFVTEYGT